MNELVAAPIMTFRELSWKPLLQSSAKHKLDNILYELEHNVISNTIRILGRHKSYCDIYILSELNGGYSLKRHQRQESEVPYVGADLSKKNQSQYCTLNVERSITLWDVNSK